MRNRHGETPLANLKAIIQAVDTRRSSDEESVFKYIHSLSIDAVELLGEADPQKKEMALVVLLLQDCTVPHVVKREGFMVTRHFITNHEMWEFACSKAHAINGVQV